jgi:hypothetical protein
MKKKYKKLTQEKQKDFLNNLQEHIRIENKFQEAVYKQIYGLTINDDNESNKVCK